MVVDSVVVVVVVDSVVVVVVVDSVVVVVVVDSVVVVVVVVVVVSAGIMVIAPSVPIVSRMIWSLVATSAYATEIGSSADRSASSDMVKYSVISSPSSLIGSEEIALTAIFVPSSLIAVSNCTLLSDVLFNVPSSSSTGASCSSKVSTIPKPIQSAAFSMEIGTATSSPAAPEVDPT